ncbi:hypothetical protein Kintu_gp55 [Xanthomonas phage Kintu]
MNRYTPGPWSIGETDPDTAEIEIVSEGRPYICLVLPGAVDDRTEANARLIAAAPELLEALTEIVAAADGDGWKQLDATFSTARAAIAKATGE